MTAIASPCVGCGMLTKEGNRCPCHARAREAARRNPIYHTRRWRARTRLVLSRHRRRWGEVCPGFERKPHFASGSNPLTVDHLVPIYQGGTDDWTNLQV